MDFAKWTSDVPGYGVQPPPLSSGYDKAVRKTARPEEARKTPSSSASARRTDSRAPVAKPPPVTSIPPRRPIMEMLHKQFAVGSPAGPSTSSTPSGGSSGAKAKESSAPHTVTSSSVYTAQEKEIASAVSTAVTATKRGTSKEKPQPRAAHGGGTSSKRDRTESRSPPGGQRKWPVRVGAQGLTAELRESGAKWQDRAVRAEEELKRLQHQYKVLDDDSRASLTRWESERTQLMAKKTAAEAEADRYRSAAAEADDECVRGCKDREEVAAKLDAETAERARLGALVKKLQGEIETLQGQVDVQGDELQTLRRSTNYVVPNGRLKLAHLPSYTEVVWASKGTFQDKQTATAEEREATWRVVTEAFRDQHRDVAAAWQFFEDQHHKYPDFDVYGALYRTTKMAVETVTSSLVQQIGQRMTGVRAGNSLATDLVGLQARSQARIEVVDMATTQDAETAELRLRRATVEAELHESRALVEQKTKDVNTMHSYGTRHAECLRSLSRALQPMAQGLAELARPADQEGEPAEVREARELECQARTLAETLTAVDRRSHSISMVRRETKSKPAIPKVKLSLLSASKIAGLTKLPQQQPSTQTQPCEESPARASDSGTDDEVVRHSEEEELLCDSPSPQTPRTPNTRSSARRRRRKAAPSPGSATDGDDLPGKG